MFAVEQLNEVDTLLFGRVTYQLMASYWPTEATKRDDPVVAKKMNDLLKVVFSRTLDDNIEWSNSRVGNDDVAQEVTQLKQQPGRDIAIFGSANLASSLIQMGSLIDEFRIMVNPVILGSGKLLFKGIHDTLDLSHLMTRNFSSGNVLLYYQPKRK
jgi:dihydrofolate reductase